MPDLKIKATIHPKIIQDKMLPMFIRYFKKGANVEVLIVHAESWNEPLLKIQWTNFLSINPAAKKITFIDGRQKLKANAKTGEWQQEK